MNNINNVEEFRTRAMEAGADDIFDDGAQEFEIYEDDGNFFVEQFNLRAAFGIGQDSTRAHFNAEANRILRSMGYDQRYHGTGIV